MRRSCPLPGINFANDPILKFKYRLALALGRTVEELDATLTVEELRRWIAYSSIEPWGEDRADWRNAQVCYYSATAFGVKGKKPKITDFLLRFDRKPARVMPDRDINKWNAMILESIFGRREARNG